MALSNECYLAISRQLDCGCIACVQFSDGSLFCLLEIFQFKQCLGISFRIVCTRDLSFCRGMGCLLPASNLLDVVTSECELCQISGQDLYQIMDEPLHHLLLEWFVNNGLKRLDCFTELFGLLATVLDDQPITKL
jgi:hypothetical protein